MSIFSIFIGSPEKQIQKLRKKVKEPHGDASVRVNAAYKLYEMGTPAAILTLLERLTISVSPATQDEEEKDQVLRWVVDLGQDALEPLKSFLRTQRQVYWPIRGLQELVSEAKVLEIIQETLQHLWESPPATTEPQAQMIQSVVGKSMPALTETVRRYLAEKDDDVTLAALEYLFQLPPDEARESVLETFLECADRPRVRGQILKKLARLGWSVKGFRAKIEESLPAGHVLTRDGAVKIIGQS